MWALPDRMLIHILLRMAGRREVLRTYREILKLARSWKAVNDGDTIAERLYIEEEARTLFRKNKNVKDENEIKLCLDEAHARLEMARHYNNPYPRPVNFAPGYVPQSRTKKTQLKRTQQATPVHIHSQEK